MTVSKPMQRLSQPDHEFQKLVRSTHAGNPAALTALGLRLMAGRDAPRSPADSVALISEAARLEDPAAWLHMATLHAAGALGEPCWNSAWAALQRAGAAGLLPAQRQLDLLAQSGIRSVTDIKQWIAAPVFRELNGSPRITACKAFIAPEWCRHLMALAQPLLQPSQVYDAQQRRLHADPMRTSSNAALSVTDSDLIVQLVRARAAHAAGVPQDHLEPPEILSYAPGQQYRLHVDFFHNSVPHFAEIVRSQGQRIRTLLVYLNDTYEGGETDFPHLDLKFRGAPGEALLFDNTGNDGTGDMRTAHSGKPVLNGDKWLFSQWIRNRLQPLA